MTVVFFLFFFCSERKQKYFQKRIAIQSLTQPWMRIFIPTLLVNEVTTTLIFLTILSVASIGEDITIIWAQSNLMPKSRGLTLLPKKVLIKCTIIPCYLHVLLILSYNSLLRFANQKTETNTWCWFLFWLWVWPFFSTYIWSYFENFTRAEWTALWHNLSNYPILQHFLNCRAFQHWIFQNIYSWRFHILFSQGHTR